MGIHPTSNHGCAAGETPVANICQAYGECGFTCKKQGHLYIGHVHHLNKQRCIANERRVDRICQAPGACGYECLPLDSMHSLQNLALIDDIQAHINQIRAPILANYQHTMGIYNDAMGQTNILL